MVHSQKLIFGNYPIIRLEGRTIPQITFRYPSDKFSKLEEVLQKLGFLPLKKGEPTSKPYQLLCDSLIDGSLFTHQSEVKELKKGVRYCYGRTSQVSISSVCSKCYTNNPKDWMKCPTMLADQGIQTTSMPSSGKPFTGAMR